MGTPFISPIDPHLSSVCCVHARRFPGLGKHPLIVDVWYSVCTALSLDVVVFERDLFDNMVKWSRKRQELIDQLCPQATDADDVTGE